jgi:hypothetical protein
VTTGPATDDQSVLGWGLNLSGAFDLFGRDTLLAQLTYGHGIGRYSNDAGFSTPTRPSTRAATWWRCLTSAC